MNLLKQKIIQHKFVIILALVCGFIYLSPQLFFIIQEQNNFSGIEFSALDAEPHYMARVRDASEGNWTYDSAFLYEYKNIKLPMFQSSETIYGAILKWIHIPTDVFFVISKFLFSAINFLLWYYFSWLILKNKRAAILSSLLLFLGAAILNNLDIAKQLSILFWSDTSTEMIVYARFVNPLLTFPFFFLGLIQLYRFYDNPTLKNALIFSAILGINFYIYFYFWTFLSVIAGLTFCYYLFTKKFQAFKYSLLASLGAGLIAFYYLLQMFGVAYGGVIESSTGNAMSVFTASHKPIISGLVIGAFALYLLVLIYKKYYQEKIGKGEIFLFLLFLSAVIVVNQQVVTGRLVEEGHFHWYANRPIVFLALAFVFSYLVSKLKSIKIQNVLYAVTFIYLILFGMGVQASGYKMSVKQYAYYQNYGPMIDWLGANSEKESVVLANDELSDLIPAYTHNNVYYAPHAIFYPNNPLERREHTVNVYYYLDHREELSIDRKEMCDLYYRYVNFKYTYGDEGDRCYNDLIDELSEEYQEFTKEVFLSQLKKYRLDYIIWDKNKNPEWKIDSFGFVEEIIETNGVVLYRVIK